VFLVGATFAIAYALVSLVPWAVRRRAGQAAALGWRIVLIAGVVCAMVVLGWGVRTWAHPPYNLRECFTDYLGNSTSAPHRTICESGRLNRPLGTKRLNEGALGAVVILAVTGVAAMRMAPRRPA
jgi:hypothetical protein